MSGYQLAGDAPAGCADNPFRTCQRGFRASRFRQPISEVSQSSRAIEEDVRIILGSITARGGQRAIKYSPA